MKKQTKIIVAISLLAIFAFILSFSICKKNEKEFYSLVEGENLEQAAYSLTANSSIEFFDDEFTFDSLEKNAKYISFDENPILTSAGRYNFSYDEDQIYNELKNFIISVANGTTSSTSYKIKSNVSFLRDIDLNYLFKSFHTKLLAELPYDFFWHDKTVGYTVYHSANNAGYVTSLVISFAVSNDYSNKGEYFTTSAYHIVRAKKALAYAKEIVAKYSHLSDIDKLIAYGNEICSLTEYETDALKEGTAYGDPWQPIHIFDQDSSTNVVCEGYAKGFKLLCDLSDFNNDIECYIVLGDVILDDQPGAHMWNVVNINGANYLVDITWADNGNVLETDRVFLAGGKTDDDHQTHEFQYGTNRTVKYKYWDSEYNMYVQGFLPLEETSYHLHNYVNSHDIFGHWEKCECGSRIFLGAHNFNSEYFHDLTTHWTVCECGLASSEEHELSTYPATCQTRAICSVCFENIGSFASHSYTECNTSDKYLYRAATCTSKALYYYSCACGRMNASTFEYGNVLEHVYDRRIAKDSYFASEATCTTKATYYYSCICGALGNDTFETGGYKSHTFDQCNPSEEYLLLPATCVRAAMYFYSCKCGARGSELFNYGDYSHDCDDNGNCSKCGQNINLENNNDYSNNDDLNIENPNNKDDIYNETETNSSINSQYSNTEYSFFQLIIEFILMLLKFIFGL